MADYESRSPENVPGSYFCDDTCIICKLCTETAPNVFKETDDGDHAFVYQQPETEEDVALAEEAIELCPIECIGKVDG